MRGNGFHKADGVVDNPQAIVVRNYILGSFTIYDLCFRLIATLQIVRERLHPAW